MTTYYLDSSALSKRYVEETGTPWLRGILAPAAGNAVVTARITIRYGGNDEPHHASTSECTEPHG